MQKACAKMVPKILTFLGKYNIPMLDYPSYSPDLAPCDFYLFHKVEFELKKEKFESDETRKGKVTRVLEELKEKNF